LKQTLERYIPNFTLTK